MFAPTKTVNGLLKNPTDSSTIHPKQNDKPKFCILPFAFCISVQRTDTQKFILSATMPWVGIVARNTLAL